MAVSDRPKTKQKTIPLDQIRENDVALRKVDRKSEKYHGLVESIRDRGVMNPIVVREVRDDQGNLLYGLVDGLHRYTAAQDAGLSEIPAHVMNMQDADVFEAQIIGNVHRVETKPVEYSKQLKRIFGINPLLTLNDMAAKLSKSPAWVSQRLSLTNLPEHVGKLVDDGKITLSNAYAMVDLCKLAPEEVDNFLDRAQTQPPTEFAPQVQTRTKAIRDARKAGKNPEDKDKFVPTAFMQKPVTVRNEYENPVVAPKVLEAMKATSPLDGWKAALAWAVHMDPLSIEEGRVKWETEKKLQEEARLKRKEERARKEAEEAAHASAEAVNA